MDPSVDVSQFSRHLNTLYKKWEEGDVFEETDSIVVLYSRILDDPDVFPNPNATKIHMWLWSLELTDTVILFQKEQVQILCSDKKASILEPCTTRTGGIDSAAPIFKIVKRSRAKADIETNVDSLMASLSNHSKVGIFLQDIDCMTRNLESGDKALHPGAFGNAVMNALKKFNTTDVTPCVGILLAEKNEQELKFIRTSASITVKMMKSIAVNKLMDVVDNDTDITHEKFCADLNEYLTNPSKLSKKLREDTVLPAFVPLLMSGGDYDFTVNAEPKDTKVHFGTMILSIGSKYKEYATAATRTYFVDPAKIQEENYMIISKAMNAAVAACSVGNKMCDMYEAAVKVIEDKNESLLEHFTIDSIGFSIGIDFDAKALPISSTSKQIIKNGMVLYVRMGLNDMVVEDAKDEKRKNYAILIGDTLTVGLDGTVTQATSTVESSFDEVSWNLEEEDDNKEAAGNYSREVMAQLVDKSSSREAAKEKLEQENARKERQRELAKRKQQEQLARLAGKKDDKRRDKRIEAYPSFDAFPREARQHSIFVDTAHEAILLPIHGLMVPFHICTVKNVAKHQEYLQITFQVPGQVLGADVYKMQADALEDDTNHFVRELMFHVPNARNLNNHIRMIKDLKKRVTQREKEKLNRDSLKVQEKLKIDHSGKLIRLHHLLVRPNIAGKRDFGVLEAHKNGFRFKSNKGRMVDLIYKNIKHAFFQPAEHEHLVLLHFRLHNPIMVGRKKTEDVQFCTEVMETSQALDNTKRRYGDNDELQDEQREKEMINKLNKDFEKFVHRVEEYCKGDLEFDIPYRELGFKGVPHRSSVFLQPTVHCLVQLIESPFFVMALEDVDRAHLERVEFQLRHFDLVFIPKELDQNVTQINQIPKEALDTLKQWLDQSDIPYTEGAMNLNWNQIMKSVRADPTEFFEQGGWDFLAEGDDDDEEEETLDPGDEEYEEDDYEDEEEYDSYEYMDDDEDDYDDEPEDEEESGEDWSDLEREAMKEDRKRARNKGEGDIDSDEEAKKQKRRRRK